MAPKYDPEREAHKAWLGLLQPVGLVVSAPALGNAQVVLDKNVAPIQQRLLEVVERPASAWRDPDPVLRDFPRFATEVLGWQPEDLAGAPGAPPVPDHLAVDLREHDETLRPTYAVTDPFADSRVLLLVSVACGPLDDRVESGWDASPQARLERLLRDTGTPAGLLLNGAELRLVYAPRGESSGHVGFPIAEMCTVGGRPILGALHMLLGAHRVFDAPDGQRLLDLLACSRKFQNEVSTRLAEQVLDALWELLRGLQAADEAANGKLLDLGNTESDHIYGGTLSVIMRLVFLLYAEDRGLMPDDEVYTRNYAVGGLYERLREDAGRYPDTMDQRYGAWAWLLSTFRLVFDGGGHAGLQLPPRQGDLFDPDAFEFLEGRPRGVRRVVGETFEAPRVPDGTIWRVLERLLVLDGERLSYRTLDVEQIGSVYESMMGFDVCTTDGRAVAVRPKDVVVDLDALLALAPAKRAAWLKAEADCDVGAAAKDLVAAATPADVVAALGRKVSPRTPQVMAPDAVFLQPGEERRRSGSHYTPRDLTEPIVRTTLRPVLEALGERPTPDAVLALKVCDPAMGSGAFLVEACRQLADALVAACEAHQDDRLDPNDPLAHARRLVAQRCLYGVDKNPFAVALAKLSLWLVTLAKDMPFTFIDHALRHGDSLVGLTRAQIRAFDWRLGAKADGPLFAGVDGEVEAALGHRGRILAAAGDWKGQQDAWDDAQQALRRARLLGDACVAAFFGAGKDKARDELRRTYRNALDAGDDAAAVAAVEALRGGERALPPFHWEVEFPEVLGRGNGGFDAIVGNPPFAGKNTTINGNRAGYVDWLKAQHDESHGNADLVAHFFRRAFSLLREGGAFGLIATNTIGQGDTRSTGLRWICTHGGTIYSATRRVKWPGLAAVVVSVVHVAKGAGLAPVLDGREVPTITAFLFHGGGHENPATLAANAGMSFKGSVVLGMGFTFDDADSKGLASPLAEMERLIAEDPRNAERIFPYIGGQELNSSPTHAHDRYVINFGEMSEAEARQWPDLMAIVEARVRPQRLEDKRDARKRYWWRFGETTPALYRAVHGLERVLVASQTSKWRSFAFVPNGMVYDQKLIVFPLESWPALCVLHSRPHELWALFFGSTMKDDPVYTPSDCFETFPFPPDWQTDPTLEAAGRAYYDFRAALMVRNDEGLTKTYNRFHDPDEHDPDIVRLRELHAAMDRAVLDAYGWTDIPTDCEFLLDFRVDEETWGNKKKPWRYRWPDEVHDEVLARLLDLNQRRYEEEVAAGLHAKGSGKKKAAPKPKPAPTPKPAGGANLSFDFGGGDS